MKTYKIKPLEWLKLSDGERANTIWGMFTLKLDKKPVWLLKAIYESGMPTTPMEFPSYNDAINSANAQHAVDLEDYLEEIKD